MKALKISKDEVRMLSVMARHYYPKEAPFMYPTSRGQELVEDEYTWQMAFTTERNGIGRGVIGWYEFVMTYLSEKIFFEYKKRNSMEEYLAFVENCNYYFARESLGMVTASKIHPIKLLYDIYLNQK